MFQKIKVLKKEIINH